MNLIKQLNSTQPVRPIVEDGAGGSAGGAVGAGAIAMSAMPLFSTLVKRNIPKNPRIIKYSEDEQRAHRGKKKKGIGLREAFYDLSEDFSNSKAEQSFDSSGVIAKLKSLEDKESVDYRDTSTFGLLDNKGEIVRVTVPSDQAQGFEQDLQHFLGDRDESEQAPEIAEVLFKLKDRYTIVNVEWPQVEEDQEESQELLDAPPEGGAEGELPAEGDLPAGDTLPAAGGDSAQVQDLLTQVIDMMKADADARKAEAQAREAEAKTKQAGAARDQAIARVKQEEQFMDMDEYNKNQKAKEKEAKRLAQLAKWKHDMAKGEGELPAQEPQYDFLPGEEEEETYSFNRRPQSVKPQQPAKGSTIRGKVTPADISKYIMSRVR